MEENEFARISPTLRQTAQGICMRMGAAPDTAEDIAQNVMLRLWQLRGNLGKIRSPEALAARIAHNLLINEWRRPTNMSLDKLSLQQLTATRENPESQLEEQEDMLWLSERLHSLPKTEHTILYMRQAEHRTTQDIAHILGITPASVNTLLSKARRQLLEEIKRRNRK